MKWPQQNGPFSPDLKLSASHSSNEVSSHLVHAPESRALSLSGGQVALWITVITRRMRIV